MKNSFIFFVVFCAFANSLSAQSLINNGNFENGNRTPNECYFPVSDNSLYGIDYWLQAQENPQCVYFNSLPPATNHCGSADWIDMALCGNNIYLTTNFNPPPTTPQNAKFIGFAADGDNDEREGIRIRLNAPLAKGNTLRIKLRMANSKAAHSAGSIDNTVWFRIVFSKFGEHWNSDPITTGNVKWELEPQEFRIQPNEPHIWYTREFFVTIPEKVDGGMISEIENMTIMAYGNDGSYFFLDDLEVHQQDPCNGACTPVEARDTIEFQVVSNPVQQWRKLTGNIDLNTTFQMQSSLNLPFAMNVKNVTYIEVRLIDGYGGKHNVLNVKNVNVLGFDDTLGFYQMWYWGAYADGSSIQSGVYAMEVSLFNCKTKSNNTVYFALHIEDGGIPNPAPIPEDWITVFENCCPVNATYNNINFTSTFKQSVETFIHAGTTGNTIVEANADVKFIAYEEIKLGNYWQVKQGATFNAVLAPCGFGKTAPSKPSKIFVTNNGFNKISRIKVYPNPVPNGDFTIEFDNDKLDEYKTIQIRDVLGKLIFTKKIAANTDLISTQISFGENQSAGIYFVEVIGSIQTLRTKFVIQ